MTQDRVCRQCGAEFRGSPHSHYCPECKARLNAKHREARKKKLQAPWNRAKVVEAILERQRQGLPLNSTAVHLDADCLVRAARNLLVASVSLFGSWEEAVKAAVARKEPEKE